LMMRNRNCKTVSEDGRKAANYSMSSRIHKVQSDGTYIPNICQATDISVYNNIIYLELSMNLSAFMEQIVYISFFTHKKPQTG